MNRLPPDLLVNSSGLGSNFPIASRQMSAGNLVSLT
jgi:hypothetical protein